LGSDGWVIAKYEVSRVPLAARRLRNGAWGEPMIWPMEWFS